MYHVALCEDRESDRYRIRTYLSKIFEQQDRSFVYSEYSSCESFLYEAQPGVFDIAIFDVDVSGESGVDAAVKLRSLDKKVIIIFTTNFPNNVFDSFSAEPLQYLLKPIGFASFSETINNALRKLDSAQSESFSFSFDNTTYRLLIRDIVYFETDRRIVNVVTANHSYKFYGKLSEIEEASSLQNFIRCHHSYLVNPEYIRSVSNNEIILRVGGPLQISRSKAKEVHKQYMKYLSNLL